MHRLSITISDETSDYITQLCANHDRSFNFIVNQLIEAAIREKNRQVKKNRKNSADSADSRSFNAGGSDIFQDSKRQFKAARLEAVASLGEIQPVQR